jgi:hypothetical protein
MKCFLCGLAAVVTTVLAASSGHAQYLAAPAAYNCPPCCPTCGGFPPGPRIAPDMCGPYFYCTNGCTWYGPSYCVRPPFEPFNGIRPCGNMPPPNGMVPPTPMQFATQQAMGGGQVALPINPWTRSPRDYFMWSNAQQDLITRQARPPFVP